MSRTKPLVFRTAFGVYTSDTLLGQGGSGKVYSARDEEGQPVAVKVLAPESVTRDKAKRFKNEILLGSAIQHKGIVRVLDHGLLGAGGRETLFYVMPLYSATLRSLIKTGSIAAGRTLPLFASLLDGVEAAHLQGIVHRDLKPENILVDEQSESLVVCDFGIARFSDVTVFSSVNTSPSARLANFRYAAPEQREQGSTVDARADIYALGLILNEMFTGAVPQGSAYKTIAAVDASFGYLDPLVDLMIRQVPEDRIRTIDDVKLRLQAMQVAFISRQRLDTLARQVVPITEVDDAIIRDPIRVVGTDVRTDAVALVFNQAPNSEWIKIFRGASGVVYFAHGQDFRQFPIHGN
jgi:serine/threonine protein kinase